MKRSPYFPSPDHYPADDEIEFFGKMIQANGGCKCRYDKATAEDELEKGIAKAVSFGTLFLANPDLPNDLKLVPNLINPIEQLCLVEAHRAISTIHSLNNNY